MPAYSLPGTEVSPRRARILGVVAFALVLVAVVVHRVVPGGTPTGQIEVALLTSQVGEGIAAGTDVRLDGVRVGSVSSIERLGSGRQRITLSLQSSQLFGLTEGMSVDYAMGNLFGISVIDLRSGGDGEVLSDGSTVDLTGREAPRLRDATLSALLETTGGLTTDVLTPKLAALLATAARDVRALSPILQAIGTTVRAFTDTQQMPPSLLLRRLGSALEGVPALVSGGVEVLYSAYTNDYLSTPEHMDRYGQMFTEIQAQLLPATTLTLSTSRDYFAGFMPMSTAVLDRLAASVRTPQRSDQQLSELLDRLGAAFTDTPNGPVLNAALDLNVVPALAAPLATVFGTHPLPGGR
ncbi:MlaD family protein [Nocardia cyriacigeorgica]|uniref:MlaD family protein n=1 Tax=Nocardia cyriacigeorgica TaxID=135487 RepID=UPI0014874E57|nr:MlaD family protein [Nocardia cyriacigeorgica]